MRQRLLAVSEPITRFAGLSGTTFQQLSAQTGIPLELLIKPNTTLWSSHSSRLELVKPLPTDVRQVHAPEQATTALVFADDAASLRDLLAAHQERLARAEVLWVAYPKGNRTDINRDSLWPILSELGLRPVTRVPIDQVWSALPFRPLRRGEAPFTGGRS